MTQYKVSLHVTFVVLWKVKMFDIGTNSSHNAKTVPILPASIFPGALIFFPGIL
jgi:hypothetical protein